MTQPSRSPQPRARSLTVIISLMNGRDALDRTLASLAVEPLAAQRIVVRIVDGNSRDAPIEVVERYEDRLSVDFRSAHDRGIYHAWNRGVAASTTPWLTFLGAGDTFLPGQLTVLLDRLDQSVDVDVLVAKACFVYESGRREIWGRPYDAKAFARWFSIVHSGASYSRRVFDRFGNFDERFRVTGDYEFLTRIAPHVRFDFLDAVLTDFPIDGVSNASLLPLKEAYLVRKRHRTVGGVHNMLLRLRATASFYGARWLK